MPCNCRSQLARHSHPDHRHDGYECGRAEPHRTYAGIDAPADVHLWRKVHKCGCGHDGCRHQHRDLYAVIPTAKNECIVSAEARATVWPSTAVSLPLKYKEVHTGQAVILSHLEPGVWEIKVKLRVVTQPSALGSGERTRVIRITYKVSHNRHTLKGTRPPMPYPHVQSRCFTNERIMYDERHMNNQVHHTAHNGHDCGCGNEDGVPHSNGRTSPEWETL